MLSYISAYLVGGLEGHYYPDLYNPACLDAAATVKSALANPDLVKGVKAHAEIGGFARWGLDVMRIASRIGRDAALPVYIHFGQLWPKPEQGGREVNPDSIFNQVVDMLKRYGDHWQNPPTRERDARYDANNEAGLVLTATIANLTTPEQKHHAAERFQKWIDDANALMREGQSGKTAGALPARADN